MQAPEGAEVKPWGWTLKLWEQRDPQNPNRIVARAQRFFARKGGYSSVHAHYQQSNLFFVSGGKLHVSRHFGGSLLAFNISLVEANDRPLLIGPGVLHQFRALSDVLGLEIYLAIDGDKFSAEPADIVRWTKNGCDE